MTFTPIWPITGPINQGFSSNHPAIDIGAPLGTPVRATAQGVVRTVTWDTLEQKSSGNYAGYYIEIDHADNWRSRYLHLLPYSADVFPGQSVSCGQIIGLVDTTGTATGPHLHFALWNTARVCQSAIFLSDWGLWACDPLELLPSPPGVCAAMPTICNYSVPNDLLNLILAKSQEFGVLPWIALGIIAAESGFITNNCGDCGSIDPRSVFCSLQNSNCCSWGLLQLNRCGGQGTNFSVDTLVDPTANLNIGLPPIKAAQDSAGVTGGDFSDRALCIMLQLAGHPGWLGGEAGCSDYRILNQIAAMRCFKQYFETVPPPPPPSVGVIGGWKGIGFNPPLLTPSPPADALVWLNGGARFTQDNPYRFENIPAGRHSVHVVVPTNWGIRYSICPFWGDNASPCHQNPIAAPRPRANEAAVNIDLSAGGIADLWWHYQAPVEIPPPGQPPPAIITESSLLLLAAIVGAELIFFSAIAARKKIVKVKVLTR